jgi:diaminopimelate decarboxylase
VPATGLAEFAGQLSAAIHEHLFSAGPYRICLEPGRWICNDAVHLLISVIDKKAPDLVITDAGTNTVGWERFETDYFPILNLTRPSLDEKPCHILGSLCTPHDVWGYMYFGDDIQPGDILMIPTQGAYTYSLRQNFIKPLPAVHTI